jgi:hypothetical protein
MFPEHRVERVYNLREAKLEVIVQRALGLGATHLKELRAEQTLLPRWSTSFLLQTRKPGLVQA